MLADSDVAAHEDRDPGRELREVQRRPARRSCPRPTTNDVLAGIARASAAAAP